MLVGKGIVTEDEWDDAIDAVEADQRTLAELDPEVQESLAEIRRIYPWFGRHEGEEGSGP